MNGFGFPVIITFGLWVRDWEGIGLRIRRQGVRNFGLSLRGSCVSGNFLWVGDGFGLSKRDGLGLEIEMDLGLVLEMVFGFRFVMG